MSVSKIYYVYHIPDKKIGMTTDLVTRVEKQQGYSKTEYEVLLVTANLKKAAEFEIHEQMIRGYPVDETPYDELKLTPNNKNMSFSINPTEQTSTFPCRVDQLRKKLVENMGAKWRTPHGEFQINDTTIDWLVDNALVSRYNNSRCFVYNKALANAMLNSISKPAGLNDILETTTFKESVYDKIREWARVRGIYDSGDVKTQYVKLMEETGELAEAILKKDDAELVDAIGDMVVVLTNLAAMNNHNIEDCIDSAYNVIADRKGKMVNGTFKKDTL
jgi:NTP pyrophosphatase (non-canonical NTP hydrolase)